MVIPPYITTIMTTRRIQVGSRKWSIRIKPTLNVGLLVMLVLWSSVLACSRPEEHGDPKTLSYDYYCPNVPAGVVCPSGSGDNTTTTPTGRVLTEYFDLSEAESRSTHVQSSKMYWGRYYPSEDYWYVEIIDKIRKGCLPDNQTRTSDSRSENHYTSAHYWNSPISRNSEPPYAKCYRAWKTENATS